METEDILGRIDRLILAFSAVSFWISFCYYGFVYCPQKIEMKE